MKLRLAIAAAAIVALPAAAHAVSALETTANSVYRDYVTDGVPTSGTWNPSKTDIKALWQQLANGLPSLSSNVQGTTNMPGLDGGKWMIYDNVTANSGAFNAPTLRITRSANYTGGAGVSNAIWADCNNGANTGVFEWCTLSSMDNFATGSGTNTVAHYAQIRKNAGAGPSWAATLQAIDMSGAADPTSELIGVEVDVDAAGTDVHTARHGITIALGRKSSVLGGTPEPTVHASDAINIGAFYPLDVGGTAIWDTLIAASGYAGNGLNFSSVNFTGYSLILPGFSVAGNTYGTLNIGATHFGAPGTLDGEKLVLLGTPGTLSTGDYSIGVGAGELWLNSGANLTFYSSGSQAGKFTSGTGWAFTGTVTVGSTTLLTTSVALSNAAASATATMTNAPVAGNPTKWISINDNGTTRRIPAW